MLDVHEVDLSCFSWHATFNARFSGQHLSEVGKLRLFLLIANERSYLTRIVDLMYDCFPSRVYKATATCANVYTVQCVCIEPKSRFCRSPGLYLSYKTRIFDQRCVPHDEVDLDAVHSARNRTRCGNSLVVKQWLGGK